MFLVSSAFAGSKESFNQGWRFARFGPVADGSRLAEPGGGQSPSAAAFDDAAWRSLDVPHDWGIEGPFRADLDGATGKLPWRGIGWYRKHFDVPAGDAGRRVFVDFDGAMANAKVWCNGQYAGTWPYGYQGFRLELTPLLKFGGQNVLAVRLDTTLWASRWYPGAGIYRNVWLVKTAPVHVGQWGVYVTTPKVAAESAEVKLAITVDNQSDQAVTADIRSEIFEQNIDGTVGNKAATAPAAAPVAKREIPSGTNAVAELVVSVPNPRLWDLKRPSLYVARTTVIVGGKAVDTYDQPFGIRAIEFTPRDGFKLNGKRVPMQGTCNHQDLGALGAALNRRALERQLGILKAMGCNALRTSHNPPAPELLEFADRMGFLVMCEAFDCWKKSKSKTGNDYARLYEEWHVRDLQAMVRHFRNHPSIVIWSSGNEVAEQTTLNPAKELHDIIHAEDPTRPVTAGVWENAAKKFSQFRFGVDVFGLNYSPGKYMVLPREPGNEKLPFLASESCSSYSSRGEYFFGTHRSNFQVSSYDLDASGIGCIPDIQFGVLAEASLFMGEFVWTGFDYLGEPSPYDHDISSPSRSSYFGIIDLAGFPKDRFYLYQAQWRPDLPRAHIVPHWNWPERLGQATPVHVHSSGNEAELFLNGKSLGRQSKGRFSPRFRWADVKYEPGTLKVVVYKGGKEWATDTVKTTGPAAQVRLEADRAQIKADGLDLSFITVRIADQDGLTVPRTHHLVKFSVEGSGEIVATDNGDATSFEPFRASQRKAYNGLALVILRATPGWPGTITLKAAADGLRAGTITVNAL